MHSKDLAVPSHVAVVSVISCFCFRESQTNDAVHFAHSPPETSRSTKHKFENIIYFSIFRFME